MAKKLEELPLFPLDTVLFPYASLQLHVFEDRYREMVRNCVEYDLPFGIVLIRDTTDDGQSNPYMVGTAVRIVQIHTYDDGRMDVHVQGERRFRIRQLDETRPYLVGYVEPVVELEVEETPEADQLLLRAREDFEQLVQKLFSRQDFKVQVMFPTDPVALSFVIANLLPMENLEKQRLLETTDTLERVSDLLPVLELQMMDIGDSPAWTVLSREDFTEWILPN